MNPPFLALWVTFPQSFPLWIRGPAVAIANPEFFAGSNPGLEAPAWLNDADEMRALVDQALYYFETGFDPKLGPVLGMYSQELGFRVVHRLAGGTYFNSNRKYKGPEGDQPGDVVSLGRTRNLKDGQHGQMLARILGPEVETPPEYRHYLVYRHTYPVLVD